MKQLNNRTGSFMRLGRQGVLYIEDIRLVGFFVLMLSCSLPASLFAQEISATLKADSSSILIGDYLQVKLTVRFSKDIAVTLPSVKDTVGTMELVKALDIDTATDDNFITYSQQYILSAYDSGSFRAGPQKVLWKSKDGKTDSLFSDALLIHVTTIPVDTAKAFKPIKEPISVAYSFSEFVPLIAGSLVLLALLAWLIYFYHSRKNRQPVTIERPKPKDPPDVWARKELKKLEDEKLWQQDEIKKYYSRLTDILRLYLEYRYGWFALESTTEKIREDISQYQIMQDAQDDLLSVLFEADLVKFAKRIPPPDTNRKVMEQAYRLIELTTVKESTESKANV